ncbi:MAG: hypothetical protein R2910_04000 [Gemmatimonadales bacterium]
MIQTRWWLALLVLVTMVHLPGSASAQDAAVKRDSAVARLNTGQQIRISGEAMSRLVGKAGVALNDTLDFAQDDAVRRIPIQAIDTLWVQGRATSTGMVIGGVTGLVIGILAAAVAPGLCEYDCDTSGGEVVGVMVVGAVAGGGLGALIGAAFPKWKRKYP